MLQSRIRFSHCFMAAMAAVFCLGTSSLHAAITLYQEDFGTTLTNYGPAAWIGYRGSNAALLDGTSGDAELFYRGSYLSSAGNWNTPGNYAYVQSRGTTATPATAMNYFVHEAGTFNPFVASNYTNLTASWSNYGNGSHRVALQVGGTWYVSTASINGGTGAGSAAPPGSTYITTSTFNLQNASWSVLNFTANSTLNISTNPAVTSAALFGSGQSITGFGFYVDLLSTTGYQTWRYDSILIAGDLVPEPGRVILLGLASIGLILRRKRR